MSKPQNNRKKPMHILQIVMKNTSTMDFSLPLLWGLRQQYPDARLSILYTTLSKKQILRNATFVGDFCTENAIEQYDFSDFLAVKGGLFSALVRKIFGSSYSDRMSLSELKNIKLKNFTTVIWSILVRYIRPFDTLVSKSLVKVGKVLPQLDPDVILFDNRTVTSFPGREQFFNYFAAEKKPVVLLPHAPHYIHATDEFCRFDEHNEDLMPSYTEHWMPFKFGEPWNAAMQHKDQFIKIGYPGTDSRWWQYLKQKQQNSSKLRCLVMSRKFLPEGKPRPEGYDEFTLNYAEVADFYRMLASAAKKAGVDVEFIIKPHPSSSDPENKKILHQAGLNNYTISYESFYELLPNIDMVVSQFTTSLALPIAYQIPTMVVAAGLQKYVHQQWPVLEQYYGGLKYFAGEADFEQRLEQMLNDVKNGENCRADTEHLRLYFEDDTINGAIKRIDQLMESSQ